MKTEKKQQKNRTLTVISCRGCGRDAERRCGRCDWLFHQWRQEAMVCTKRRRKKEEGSSADEVQAHWCVCISKLPRCIMLLRWWRRRGASHKTNPIRTARERRTFFLKRQSHFSPGRVHTQTDPSPYTAKHMAGCLAPIPGVLRCSSTHWIEWMKVIIKLHLWHELHIIG